MVHVIRNSTKYVGYKYKKEFCADLKAIYQAPTEEAALNAFETLEGKWGKKYPLAVNVWERNWNRISAMFEFTPEIRQLIYTTNPIESFHRQLRKVTKNRGVNTSDDSVLKLLYLATQEVVRKWTIRIRDWNLILAQLAIHLSSCPSTTALKNGLPCIFRIFECREGRVVSNSRWILKKGGETLDEGRTKRSTP